MTIELLSKWTRGSLVLIAAAALGCSGAADAEEHPDGVSPEEEGQPASTASPIIGGEASSAVTAVGALVNRFGPFCTATAVAPRVLVTAAHCLRGVRPSSIAFAVGASAVSPDRLVPITQVIPHPGFDSRSIRNDIGVVILGADAGVTPVGLNPSMDASWVDRELVFMGYGATNGFTRRGGGAKRLVRIPVAQVGSTQFAYVDGTKNTCFGDSGGPAFAVDDAGGILLVGVTSYGDGTCSRFGVDTRVDAFQSFIASAGAN